MAVRRRRLTSDHCGGRRVPLELAVALRDFLHDPRKQPVFHHGSLRILNDVADGEFERAGIYSERDGSSGGLALR